MESMTFQVDGLHCQGCAKTVSAVLRELDTVTGVEVDLGDGGPSTVRVRATGPLTVADIAEALRDEDEFSVVGA